MRSGDPKGVDPAIYRSRRLYADYQQAMVRRRSLELIVEARVTVQRSRDSMRLTRELLARIQTSTRRRSPPSDGE